MGDESWGAGKKQGWGARRKLGAGRTNRWWESQARKPGGNGEVEMGWETREAVGDESCGDGRQKSEEEEPGRYKEPGVGSGEELEEEAENWEVGKSRERSRRRRLGGKEPGVGSRAVEKSWEVEEVRRQRKAESRRWRGRELGD